MRAVAAAARARSSAPPPPQWSTDSSASVAASRLAAVSPQKPDAMAESAKLRAAQASTGSITTVGSSISSGSTSPASPSPASSPSSSSPTSFAAASAQSSDSGRRRVDTGIPTNTTKRILAKRAGFHGPDSDSEYSDPDRDDADREDRDMCSTRRREKKLIKLAASDTTAQWTKTHTLPQARVFYPTVDEFADPIQYIARIQREAEVTGICKIVPPKGWKPHFAINLDDDSNTFETRLQRVHQLQQGRAYGDGRVHNFRSYRAHAEAFKNAWSGGREMTSDEIEQDYWRIVETGVPNVEVEYANDLDTTQVGSGFERATERVAPCANGKEVVDFDDPEYYKRTAWNLNNLPDAYGSLLRHVHTAMNGINVPWLYCGMLFASFCWHTEDNYMYSVNYQHLGANKRWYGIPSAHCSKFDAAARRHLPERFAEEPDLLFHITTMIPPSVLAHDGVDVFTLVQEPGDIVLTFPRAYHAGFSEGFNCNEAVNFLLPNWIQYSRECVEKYREVARVSIFSHDHFMFHFGASQSLDEYSVEDCEMLLRELRLMFHEEQYYKKTFQADGLVNVIELSADVMLDDLSMTQDELRQCFECRHNIFFSGVTCACSASRLACLRHAKRMCRCPMHKRSLIQWVTSAELKYAIRRVQEKMRALRAQQPMVSRSGVHPELKWEPLSGAPAPEPTLQVEQLQAASSASAPSSPSKSEPVMERTR